MLATGFGASEVGINPAMLASPGGASKVCRGGEFCSIGTPGGIGTSLAGVGVEAPAKAIVAENSIETAARLTIRDFSDKEAQSAIDITKNHPRLVCEARLNSDGRPAFALQI
jgi:hypothetical protein